MDDADVIVLGAGPNGLTAAATLAREGLDVLVLEANAALGGSVRTAEVTLPGFRHDVGAGFYPLLPAGPLGQLPLERYGLRLCNFDRPYGGATPGGRGVSQHRSPEASAASFEAAQPGDGAGYRELWDWWQWAEGAILNFLYHPLGDPRGVLRGIPLLRHPRRLLELSQLTASGARTAATLAFRGEDAQVWFVGSVLHSDLAPESAGGAAFSLLLMGLSQQVGMPIPAGGAQALPDAAGRYLQALGCIALTNQRAEQIVVRQGRAVAVRTATDDLVARRAVLATVEPQRLFLELVGTGHLPSDFVRLVRRYRRGTGTFKLDCALDGLPSFAAEALQGTGVFHLAESVETMSASTNQVERGLIPTRPVLIGGIHTLADPSRAPAGKHTLWIETHVPSRIQGDAAGSILGTSWSEAREPFADRILAELEHYSPGVGALVLGRHAQAPDDLAVLNPNVVAGDITAGSVRLDQQLVFRPFPGWFYHRTPLRGLYLGGASTHPGPGVHGGGGANAARVLLVDLRLQQARAVPAAGWGRLSHRVRRLVSAAQP
jgi:phytoene dehydrogenase-like protein